MQQSYAERVIAALQLMAAYPILFLLTEVVSGGLPSR